MYRAHVQFLSPIPPSSWSKPKHSSKTRELTQAAAAGRSPATHFGPLKLALALDDSRFNCLDRAPLQSQSLAWLSLANLVDFSILATQADPTLNFPTSTLSLFSAVYAEKGTAPATGLAVSFSFRAAVLRLPTSLAAAVLDGVLTRRVVNSKTRACPPQHDGTECTRRTSHTAHTPSWREHPRLE